MYHREEEQFYFYGVVALISLLVIGPVIGSIVATIDNKNTIDACKELCATYDKRPQCAVCCEMVDWRYTDRRFSNGCY